MLVRRDLNELNELREQLVGGAWLMMTAQRREELIRRFCQGYILPPLSQFTPTTYRAQANTDGTPFQTVRRLLAPPPEAVSTAGRLNRPGKPTLYLASDAIGAMFELRPAIGDMITILACRMRPDAPPLQVAPVAMTRLGTSRQRGPLSPINIEGPLGFQPFADFLAGNDLLEQWQLQDDTLSYVLTFDPSPEDQQALYDLTNGVRDHLYSRWSGWDGVRFPGIMSNLTSINTAVDEHRWGDIEPLEVWVARVGVEMTAQSHGRAVLYTEPLVAFGTIGPDDQISYSTTSKSLLCAMNDFKQRHGRVPLPDGLEPMLVRPFARYRISYGVLGSAPLYDFHLA